MSLEISCPLSTPTQNSVITMAHGGGGKKMREFITQELAPLYSQSEGALLDSAILQNLDGRVAFTSDSFVVHPLFFPGGNIGDLAVNGTVNDLAMVGANPLYLSLSFIIEEGFKLEKLRKIIATINTACQEAGVRVVTGDTKVVERGKADGLFINTSGIGVVPANVEVGPQQIQPGDAIIVNGDIGRHGVSVLSSRDGFGADVGVKSDCCPLNHVVSSLLSEKVQIHCLRDLTRGGLAAGLNELAMDRKLSIILKEQYIPVSPLVHSYCEILGLEAYHLANEGRFVLFVPDSHKEKALSLIRSYTGFEEAAVIGHVDSSFREPVKITTPWGSARNLPLLTGEQLPRIC